MTPETAKPKSAARSAREAAGLSVAQAAKLARCCEDFLSQIERGRGTSSALAARLSRIYGGCDEKVFLPQRDALTRKRTAGRRQTTTRPPAENRAGA